MIGIAHDNESFECERHNDPRRGAAACRADEREAAAYGHLLVDYVQWEVDAKVRHYLLACVVEKVHHQEQAVGDGQRDQVRDRRGARELGAAEHLQREQIANDAHEADRRGEVNVYFADHALHVTFRVALRLAQTRVSVGHFFSMQFSRRRRINACSIRD